LGLGIQVKVLKPDQVIPISLGGGVQSEEPERKRFAAQGFSLSLSRSLTLPLSLSLPWRRLQELTPGGYFMGNATIRGPDWYDLLDAPILTLDVTVWGDPWRQPQEASAEASRDIIPSSIYHE
jgi:hypothetical protein